MIALAVLALSCVGSRPVVGPRTISKSDLRARIKLGSLSDMLPGTEAEGRRLEQITRLAFSLGNFEEARSALTRLVEMTTNRLAVAKAEGLAEEVAKAEMSYQRAQRFALKTSRKLQSPGLMLDVLGLEPAPQHHKEFLQAALRRGSVTERTLEVAMRLAKDNVGLRIALHAGSDSDGELDAAITTEELVASGAIGIASLEARWREVADTMDGKAVRAMNTSILAVDPLYLPARISELYWDDVEAGRIKADEDIAEAAFVTASGGAQIIRLQRAVHAKPGVESLALGFVHQLYKSGLAGDAHAQLAISRKIGLSSPKAKSTAKQLEAIIALRAGDVHAYRRWSAGHKAGDSVYMTELEIRFAASEEQTVWTSLVREARVRAFHKGFDRRGVWWRNRFIASDPAVASAVRNEVIAKMRDYDSKGAIVARYCLESSSSHIACEQVFDDVDELDEGEGLSGEPVEILRRVRDVRDLPPSLLWGFTGNEAAALAPMREMLESLGATSWASSQAYVALRLQVLLASDDSVAAGAYYANSGALLSAGSRLTYGLAIADVQAGKVSIKQALAVVSHRYQDYEPSQAGESTNDDTAWVAKEYAGAGASAAYIRGRSYWNSGHAVLAVAEWKPLLGVIKTEEAHFAGFLALAAQRAGDSLVLAKAKGLLGDGATAVRLRAHLAAAELAADAPAKDWAKLRTVLFFSDHTLLSYFRALCKRMPDAAGLAAMRAFFATDAPNLDWDRTWLRTGLAHEWLRTGADAGALIAAAASNRDVRAAQLPVKSLVDPHLAGLVSRYLYEEVSEATSAAEARALAKTAAATIAKAADTSLRRRMLAWLYLLDGKGKSALEVATKKGGETEPYNDNAKLVMAAKEQVANPGVMGEELVWKLWKHVENGDDEHVLDLAQDLSDRSTAADGGLSLGCRLLIDADLQDEALKPCMLAWSKGAATSDLAAALSYLMVNRTPQARALGFDVEGFFAAAPTRLKGDADATWLQNYSIWLRGQERVREAAEMADEAWARGSVWGGRPDGSELKQALYRGLGLRRQAQAGYRGSQAGRDVLLAFIALLEGRVDVARYYAIERGADGWSPVDRDLAQAEALVVGLLDLAAIDMESGAVDAEGVGLWLRASSKLGDARAVAAFAARYGSSLLYLMTKLEDGSVAIEERIRLGKKLAIASPKNLLVTVDLAQLYVADKKFSAARKTIAEGLVRYPEHPILTRIVVPSDNGGGSIAVLAKHKLFVKALAKVTPAQLDALEPVRYRHLGEATSAYMPSSAETTRAAGIALTTQEGARLLVRSFARAAMCEGLDCLAGIPEGLAKQGFKEVWRAPVTLPAGAGADLLSESETGYLLTTVIPIGGRLFVLYFAGPADAASKSFAGMRLMRDSFRPLDRWMPAPAAEALRTRTAYLRDDVESRKVQRLLLGTKATAGCPIKTLLRSIEDEDVRAQVLLEAVLDAGSVGRRKQLFTCTEPTSPAAARLGIVALLSGDGEEYEFGRAVAKEFPDPTAADAIEALLVEDVSALSATKRQAGARVAPFGILQVLSALPKTQRQMVAARMLKTDSTRNRSLTLMAAGVIEDAMPSDLLRLQIRNSPANAAAVAVRSAFFDTPDAKIIAATRKRVDAMKAPLDTAQRALLSTSVLALVSLLDKGDAPRLKRLEALAGKAKEVDKDAKERARSLQSFVGRQRKRHARALELRALKTTSDTTLDEEDAGARALIDAIEANTKAASSGPSASRLAVDPLPSLLEGASWNYVRVQQPGLFAATLRGLYVRLRGASKLDSVVLRRIGTGLSSSMGLDLFADEGGLDLSRPIECASPGSLDYGFVCAAFVKDERRVREQLAKRSMGSDTSLALAMRMAQGGIMAPMFAVGAPLFLHSVIRESGRDPSANAKVVAEERLRSVIPIAGHKLERLLIAQANEDGHAVFDSEHYLFISGRLFAFSNRNLAQQVLGSTPEAGSSLRESTDFREASKDWKDGASLQAFMLGGSGMTFDEANGLEIFADSEGLRVRVPAGTRSEFSDAGHTAALIPGTPISKFSFGSGSSKGSSKTDSKKSSEDLFGNYDSSVLGVVPPLWLMEHAERASFAWYQPTERGSAKGKLWSDWIAIAEGNAKTQRALRKHRVRLPRIGKVTQVGELFYGKSGSLILVSSNRARMDEALALAANPPKRESEFLSGAFDGKASAAAIRAVAAGLSTELKNTLNIFAIYASAIEVADFTTSIRSEGGRPVFEGRLRPRLAKEGVDVNTVDQWLASPRIRNSATLPKPLSPKQLEKTLILLLEVDEDPESLANSFVGLSRLTATVVGTKQVRVTIQPGVKPTQSVAPAALTASARKELLGSTGLLNPAHPRVKKLAAKIVPKGSTPNAAAKAILEWIESNVEYEITPQAVDAIDVLDKKRGDCTEYSVLAVSLLRASGVPAELRQGMAVQNAEMVAHNWIAYHDGTGWRESDPTAGTAYVGSGHIEASLLEFISLISVGGLTIISAEVGK